MDAAPPPPAPGPELVRLSEPDEIAEALPHLLGFRPHESVVLVGLGGPSGTRVLVSVRGDLPPAGPARRPPWQPATDLASELVTALLGGAVEQIGAALV